VAKWPVDLLTYWRIFSPSFCPTDRSTKCRTTQTLTDKLRIITDCLTDFETNISVKYSRAVFSLYAILWRQSHHCSALRWYNTCSNVSLHHILYYSHFSVHCNISLLKLLNINLLHTCQMSNLYYCCYYCGHSDSEHYVTITICQGNLTEQRHLARRRGNAQTRPAVIIVVFLHSTCPPFAIKHFFKFLIFQEEYRIANLNDSSEL